MLDDLAGDVTAALASTLRSATLWKQIPGGEDEWGNPLPATWQSYACEGIRGSFESVLAGLSGIPRTDAKIELLAGTLSVEPNKLDKVHIDGGWWSITEIEVDPAGAWWVLQCSATTAVS